MRASCMGWCTARSSISNARSARCSCRRKASRCCVPAGREAGQPAARAHASPAAVDGADALRAAHHQSSRAEHRGRLHPASRSLLPLRHPSGRTMGILALFRDQDGRGLQLREAHIVAGLARSASASSRSSTTRFRALHRARRFEQRVRALIGAKSTRAAGPRCTSTPTSCTSSTITAACTSAIR